MNTTYYKFFVPFFLFIGVFLFGQVDNVSAQSCSGTLNCCSSQTCNVGSGEPCNGTCNGTSSCPWTYNNCDNSIQCSLNTSPSCNNQASCSAVSKNIVVGGSCTLTNPPTTTPSPTAVPTPPAGSQTCFNCNPGWCQAVTIPDTSSCPSPNNCDACPGTTPTPPPGGVCTGITYSFSPVQTKYDANSSVLVNIDRSAGSSCSGNWDFVNLEFDGVSQSVALNGATAYTSTVNAGISGAHSVRLTVNNGTCDCNLTTLYTMPDGNFDTAVCTAGQPYNDLSFDFTASVIPGTCNNFDRVRYWLNLSEDNPLDVTLLNDIGKSNATWVGEYGGGPGLEHLYMIIQVNPPITGNTVSTVFDDADLIGNSGWRINDLSNWTAANGQLGRTYSIGGNIMCDSVQNDWIGGKNIMIQPDACAPEPICNSITTYGDISLLPGETRLMSPTVDTTPANSATDVVFSVTNALAAFFSDVADDPPVSQNPYTDNTVGFSANLYGAGSPGDTTTYTIDSNSNTVPMCSTTGNVTITNPAAWWQAKEGSAIAAGGNVFSDIPFPSCEPDTSCDPNLISFDRGGGFTYTEFPGVVMASGNNISAGAGYVSDVDVAPTTPNPHNWTAASASYANISDYDYDFFEGKVSSSISRVTSGGTLTSGGFLDANGYTWYFDSGPLTITNAQNLTNRKVVLFVDGDVFINNTINLTDGTGFFMLVSSGSITVNRSVGGAIATPNYTTPELEGIFVADGMFATDSEGFELDTKNLHIRGSVMAGNISLDRSLSDNSVVPGEFFEYGSDIVMHFPHNLTTKRIRWREVAP